MFVKKHSQPGEVRNSEQWQTNTAAAENETKIPRKGWKKEKKTSNRSAFFLLDIQMQQNKAPAITESDTSFAVLFHWPANHNARCKEEAWFL